MKKAKYKTGEYKKHIPIRAGELFRHIDTISCDGKSDFTAKVIDAWTMEIIEPSVRQKEESIEFWTGHVTAIEPNWYLRRGLEVVGQDHQEA